MSNPSKSQGGAGKQLPPGHFFDKPRKEGAATGSAGQSNAPLKEEEKEEESSSGCQ
jgi:hypothetical protein